MSTPRMPRESPLGSPSGSPLGSMSRRPRMIRRAPRHEGASGLGWAILGWLCGRWKRFRSRPSGRHATAALEFALASPLLTIMLGGAADFGLASYYRASLANAVAAGCEYALLTPGFIASNVQTVVQNTMPPG